MPLDRVTVIQGDTALTPDQGVTFGSLSIQNGGMQIRQAAATGRQALIAEGAAKLGVAKDAVIVKDGVVVPKSGGKGVAYSTLVGGKDFRLAVDAKAPLKDPKDYTIVGQSIRRLDIPDKVTGRFTYMQDYKRKGMLHARVIRPAGDESVADVVERLRLSQGSGVRRGREERQFPCRARTHRMGGDRGEPSDRHDVVRLGGTPRSDEAVGVRARHQGRQGRGPAEGRRRRRGVEDAEREARQGELRLRDPHARVDRPVVRGGRVPRRQAHVLDRVAADASPAQADRDDARHEARRRALHLHRGLRLLWPQRARGCGGGRVPDRKGDRTPGSRPVDAAGRAWLGPQGTADASRLQRGARRPGECRRLALAGVPSGPSEGHRGRAAAGGARRAADRSLAPGQRPGLARDPVHVPQYPRDRALARRNAVPPVVDPHARPDAEHVRQRELHRRDRGRSGRGPARIPIEEHERPARRRAVAGAPRARGVEAAGACAPRSPATSRAGAAWPTSSTSSCAPT